MNNANAVMTAGHPNAIPITVVFLAYEYGA